MYSTTGMSYSQGIGVILRNREVAPGHYRMEVRAPFVAERALPGQFVMVKAGSGATPLLRRPFGIYEKKTEEGSFDILYRVVGEGTLLMSELAAGVEIDIIGPLGNGFDLTAAGGRPLLVAGGVGVAPLFTLAEALVSAGAKVTALIGGRNRDELLSIEDLKGAGSEVMTATDDGTAGYRGFVTGLMEEVLEGGAEYSSVYACGPKPMLKEIGEMARRRGVPCQLSLEALMACGFGVCLGCIVKTSPPVSPPHSHLGKRGESSYSRVCCEGPVFSAEEVVWDEA